MKHVCLLALLLPFSVMAQLPFEITVLNQPYAPLLEATALEASQYDYPEGWDDPEFSVPLGFDFSLNGAVISSLDQFGVGALMMGTTLDDKSGLPLLHGFIPTNLDLTDRGIAGADPSIIRWQTTGEPGNRVFAIEWANAGLYEEIVEDSLKELSHVNLQLRLFEADGVIEYHYGASEILTVQDEPAIAGILSGFDPFSYDGDVYALDGDAADPTLQTLTNVDDWSYGGGPFLSAHPADGTVYRFGPVETVGVAEAGALGFSAWPNPTRSESQLRFEGQHSWTVHDATGRVVGSGSGLANGLVDLNGMVAGTYTVRLDNGAVRRLIKH